MAKKIRMLKPGTFTAMNGHTYSFSEADLRATAAAYDPTVFAAPIVKGHPTHDAPAYGRIYSAEFADGHLLGTPGKVDPAFAEEVNAGRFDNVSLSLYPPEHPSNPVPGVFYPRHLGFLGAMPPAVKGLGQVNLSEDEEGVIRFAEMDMTEMRDPKDEKQSPFNPVNKGATRMDMKERAQFCAECKDTCCKTCCPNDAISITTEKGAVIDPAKCCCCDNGCTKCCEACCMMEGPVRGMMVANYAEQERANRKRTNAEFVEGLVKEGKVLPANRLATIAVLDFCTTQAGGNIEFGEGSAKKTQSPAEAFRAILSSGPKLIQFGELGGGEEPGREQTEIPGDITRYV